MNKILYSKTPRQLASEIIAVLGFILLSISFKAIDITDCNAGELLHQVQTMRSRLNPKFLPCSKEEVLTNVIANYKAILEDTEKYDSTTKKASWMIISAIDTIWGNEVGRLLLRSFYQNMRGRSGLTIDYTSATGNSGNCISHGDHPVIYINFEKMERTSYIGYIYGVPDPVPFKETLDAMLFHEILHGYHNLLSPITNEYLEKCEVANALHGISPDQKDLSNECRKPWSNNEEIRTISGWYIGSDGNLHFDWLNGNSYMILQALKQGLTPIQRTFHCVYEDWLKIHEVIRNDIWKIVIPQKMYIDRSH